MQMMKTEKTEVHILREAVLSAVSQKCEFRLEKQHKQGACNQATGHIVGHCCSLGITFLTLISNLISLSFISSSQQPQLICR